MFPIWWRHRDQQEYIVLTKTLSHPFCKEYSLITGRHSFVTYWHHMVWVLTDGITKTNVNFSLVRRCGIHKRAIFTTRVSKLLFCIMSLAMVLSKLLSHIPGANGLTKISDKDRENSRHFKRLHLKSRIVTMPTLWSLVGCHNDNLQCHQWRQKVGIIATVSTCYTSASTKMKWRYTGFTLSVCPSVRLWAGSYPLCIFMQYFIFAHRFKQLQKVCRV